MFKHISTGPDNEPTLISLLKRVKKKQQHISEYYDRLGMEEFGLEYDTRQNGPLDAFRHALASAELTIKCKGRPELAAAVGFLSEAMRLGVQSRPAFDMDNYNNEEGRKIGKKLYDAGITDTQEVASYVFSALENEKLSVMPEDTWTE